MPNQRLIDYINSALSKGYDITQIRSALLTEGWPIEEVDSAINFLTASKFSEGQLPQQPIQQQNLPPEKISFFKKIKLVLAKPAYFFERIKSEPGIGKAIVYFLLISVIVLILNLISQTIQVFAKMGSIAAIFTGLLGIFGSILYLIIALIMIFGFALIINLVSKIFKAEGGYHQAFKAVVYSQTIMILSFIISLVLTLIGLAISLSAYILLVITIILFLWSLAILVNGIMKLYDLNLIKSILTVLISFIIIAVLFYLIFVLILGVSLPLFSMGGAGDFGTRISEGSDVLQAGTFCQEAEDLDACWAMVAACNGDGSICERIPDPEKKEECIEEVRKLDEPVRVCEKGASGTSNSAQYKNFIEKCNNQCAPEEAYITMYSQCGNGWKEFCVTVSACKCNPGPY